MLRTAEGTKQNIEQHKTKNTSCKRGVFCYNQVMKRVGILRGGMGEYYRSSLQKGGEIISHIFENLPHKYKVFDILIDREGVWHINGVPIIPADLIHKVDVVWDTTHSNLSTTLDNFSIPNIGVSSFSTNLQNSKEMLREHMKKVGVEMARHIILPIYQKDFDGLRERYPIKKAKEIHEKFGTPWIVKSLTPDLNMGPVRGREGSQRPSASNGMGIHLAKTFPELVNAIEDGLKHEQSILIEEFIEGKIVSMHSMHKFRNQDIYTFPLGNLFGGFSIGEKEMLTQIAKNLHNHVDAKHYLKSDFILTPRGKVYLLGIESHPSLKEDSHFSQVCESVGVKTEHAIEHILEHALR